MGVIKEHGQNIWPTMSFSFNSYP